MKKLLALLIILLCLGAKAQVTTVYDTTVVRTPLTVSAKSGAGQYDSLYLPAATTSVNGYMTTTSMTDIANLQTSMTTANSNIASLQSSITTLQGYITTNTQTGATYTIQSSDHTKLVMMTNTATVTVTIPTGLPTGFTCRIMQQGGIITVAPATGVTIRSPFSYRRSQTQGSILVLIHLGGEIYSLSGNVKQ